jgi:hypothetical protein
MFFKSKKTISSVELSAKEVVGEFLNSKQFRYEFDENHNLFSLNLAGNHVNWRCLIYIDNERKTICIRSYYPITIQDQQKIKMAELVARINSRIVLGSFIIDFEQGDIAFDTTHLHGDEPITPAVFEKLYYTNCQTLDEHFKMISAVNLGYTEPVLAVQ